MASETPTIPAPETAPKTANQPTYKSSWTRRILFAFLALLALIILVILALRFYITTASGARFIENQINGRSFGPVESVEISGLSGDPLDNFTVSKIEVRDKDGVWLTARDLTLAWSPLALRERHVKIDRLKVDQVNALRRPVLNDGEPYQGEFPKISAQDILVSELILQDSVLGQKAVFTVAGGGTLDDDVIAARLDATRTDAAGDKFKLDFTKAKDGNLSGEFDIRGVAGGPIARLIQAPDNLAVIGVGDLAGTPEQGQGDFNLAFGAADVARGSAAWTAEKATLNADIDIGSWTRFEPLSRRAGDKISLTGSVDRAAKNAPFTLSVKAPKLALDANGALPDEGYMPERANIKVAAARVSDFVDLPEGFTVGDGSASGDVTTAPGYAFNGRVNLASVKTPYGTTSRISGPLAATQSADGTYRYNTDLNFSDIVLAQSAPIELGRSAKITSKGRIDLDRQKINFETSTLVSGPTNVTAKGQATWDTLTCDISGTTQTAVLAQGALPAGALNASYDISKTESSAIALSTEGRFAPDTPFAAPIGTLIGEELVFQTRMSPIDGGIAISEANVSGDNIRAALEGRITDTYDISGEALLSSPVTYKSAALGETSEASFTLTGPRTDPDLRLDAKSSDVTISGQTLTSPRLRVEVQDIFEAPKGPVQFEAQTAYGDLLASAQFASRPGVYVAEDIVLTLDDYSATGALSVPESGLMTGQFEMDLPEEDGRYARASIALAPRGTEQGVTLNVDAKDIELANFEFDKIIATADGTLAQLAGEIDTKGRRIDGALSRGFELAAPVTLTRTPDNAYRAETSPEGSYGDIALGASAPIEVSYDGGTLSLTAPLTVAAQPVDIVYEREPGRERLKLSASNLPVTLLPMPGNLADTRGRMAADVNLESTGGSTTGRADFTLKDWRGFDMKRETGIDATAVLTVDDRRANLALEGTAVGDGSESGGFTVDGQAEFGLNGGASLTGLRLDSDAPVSGDFKASGTAASIFGLVTPSDAELGGSLDANLRLTGTASAPLIDGQAAGQGIRFEAPELGTRIRDGRFTARFRNDSLSVTDLYVSDSDNGTLQGGGEFTLGELGRPIGSLNIDAKGFQALDRKDMKGRVSGKMAYESRAKDSGLTGNIKINEVEVRQFVTGKTSVIEIEVEEINRPEDQKAAAFQEPALPINLDINLTAPRKIYVRSRGLDVELSTDLRITGTLTEPILNGDAEVVRGGYKIAGKELQFTEGLIKFNGKLADARLDLVAETETTDITAKVDISGTVKDPEITLTSTPDRPQDEILSVLLFGRSATELSTIEAAQLAGALAQFSGSGAGFDLLGGLRDAFGIGQLSVGFADDGTAQITGGRYLAKNVYLQVFSGANGDQTGAVIDWEIRKNISLRSKLQSGNAQEISLSYKKDF